MMDFKKEIRDLVHLILEEKESREDISQIAAHLIQTIEAKELEIDPELFSFLLYIEGFDMPGFERDYLFSMEDFNAEYAKVKNKLC